MTFSRQRVAVVLLVGLGVLTASCAAPPQPADLVLVGGTIITMDAENSPAEALAARGQEIVAVGSEAEVRRFIGDATEVIDLEGATAVPGLIEGHAHFLSVGRAKMQLDLRGTGTWSEVVSMVEQAVVEAEPGQWILGRGWHQEKWNEAVDDSVEGMPRHNRLSEVAPDNPVRLSHASGHAVIVNALALKMAGIDASTPDPVGGEIVRDAKRRPTGVLRETAEELVGDLVSDPSEAELRRRVELAAAECLSKGITSFQDAGSTLAQVDLLAAMAEAGELDIRLWLMLGEENDVIRDHLERYRLHGVGGEFLSVGGIKRYMDGALGAHGAWLLQPYTDRPETSGLRIEQQADLDETARLALEHGYQLCVHAIGDRANRETLDTYQRAFADFGKPADRWRIEHAQHLHPEDVPRFAELRVIASMQPTHCTSDGPWVPLRLGEQRSQQGAYLWRSLIDSGAVLSAGTDAPVEDVNPLATFHAAVTREMAGGESFYPEQCMSRKEALKAMTLDAAYSAFEEQRKGSLEVGKLADVTVLSQDILSVPEEQILSTTVRYTVVGGEVKYRFLN